MRERLLTRKSRSKRIVLWSIIAACALMLTGCQLLTPRSKVEPPPSLTKPCPALTPLDDVTGAGIIRKFIEISQQYYECADSKEALIKAVK